MKKKFDGGEDVSTERALRRALSHMTGKNDCLAYIFYSKTGIDIRSRDKRTTKVNVNKLRLLLGGKHKGAATKKTRASGQ